jgi:hypothetical protein
MAGQVPYQFPDPHSGKPPTEPRAEFCGAAAVEECPHEWGRPKGHPA